MRHLRAPIGGFAGSAPRESGRGAQSEQKQKADPPFHLDAVAKISFGSVNFSDLVLTSCLVLPDRKQCLKNS